MPLRPTHYPDVHDEFYHPAGLTSRERKPIRKIGYAMGLRGQHVNREFLDDQAEIYHGRLNSALHTIDQRSHIVHSRSWDLPRNLMLGILAVGGFVIVGLALMVDYHILEDFWTTIYQNKFLQVPETLKDNVVFKSLQVLFAVIAIHFLISVPGVAGKVIRGGFIMTIGVMVIAMLVGLGFLAANSTLPADATLRSHPVHPSEVTTVSNEDILAGLGLRPSSGSEAAKASSSSSTARSTKPATLGNLFSNRVKGDTFGERLWGNISKWDFATLTTAAFYGTFTLIFLFVSSVGALCMHYSLRAFKSLFGGIDPEHTEHALPGMLRGTAYWALGKGEWRARTRKDLADQRQRILHAQRLIGDAGYRENLMGRFFADFAAGYMEGLTDREHGVHRIWGSGDIQALRDEMRGEVMAARADWDAGRIADRLPDLELRTSLGYDPNLRITASPVSFAANLIGLRHVHHGGELGEDTRRLEPAPARMTRIPSPSTDNPGTRAAIGQAREPDTV